MAWPQSQDYNEAVQNPQSSFGDSELRGGQAVGNALGIPMPRSGNFADVYEFIGASGQKWAVKCFTRQIPGLQERYSAISKHLLQAKLPFTVDFSYLAKGIRIRGEFYPILKMQWVEGFLLNEFVRDNLDKPALLDALGQIWLRMAKRLREADIAHADLQHGNVILVPGSKASSLSVRLIDYDGMWVPALADQKSGEVGHPAYQHPQRLQQGIYNADVDRLPLLAIACALRCLAVGGEALWDKYDNGDNLLFREADLCNPTSSGLFKELRKLNDAAAHDLTGYLAIALSRDLGMVPHLEDLISSSGVRPLSGLRATARSSSSTAILVKPRDKEKLANTSTSVPDWSLPDADYFDNRKPADIPGREPTRSDIGKIRFVLAAIVGLILVGWLIVWLMQGRNPSEESDVALVKKEIDVHESPDGKPYPNKIPEMVPMIFDQARVLPPRYTNRLGIEFALVPKGKRLLGGGGKMGNKQMEISHDFYLGVYEVTQEEWQKVMGMNPSHFSRSGGGKDMVSGITDADLMRFPVENIMWNDCQAFVLGLNERFRESGWVYRLPTAAEWEYACQDGLSLEGNVGKTVGRPCKVGSYPPNRLGFYDMHGNVSEFCQDSFGVNIRGCRGGSWIFGTGTNAGRYPPSYRQNDLGLRLARVEDNMATTVVTDTKVPVLTKRIAPLNTNRWLYLNKFGALGVTETGNVLRIHPESWIGTKESYSGPIEITAIARTEKQNIRLYAYNGASIIFNWEVNPNELRVNRPDGTNRFESGSLATTPIDPLLPNNWYNIRWRLAEQGMTIKVNDKTVYSERKEYNLSGNTCVYVKACKDVVDVSYFAVQRLPRQVNSANSNIKSRPEAINLAPYVLKQKLRGNATYDNNSATLTIAYNFQSPSQLEDFDMEKGKSALDGNFLQIQPNGLARHKVKFKEVNVKGVVLVKSMSGTLMSSTGGTVVRLAENNPDTIYLDLGDGHAEFKLPPARFDNLSRQGNIPFSFEILPASAAFVYGNRNLSVTGAEAQPGFVAFTGGGAGFSFGQLVFSGKMDTDWAKTFFADSLSPTKKKAAVVR